MIERDTYNVVLRLTEDLLGTVPMNRDVFTQHIQAKAQDQMKRDAKRRVPLADGVEATEAAIAERLAQEQDTLTDLPGEENRGWTTFHRDDEGPFLYDYAMRGYLKGAAGILKEWGNLKGLKAKVTQGVFVLPRKLRLVEVSGQNERPLRADTPRGPRVTVVRSDTVAAGAVLRLQLVVLRVTGIAQNCLADLLSYGELQGLGQWRSGGWGRFVVEQLELVGTKAGRKAQRVGSATS